MEVGLGGHCRILPGTQDQEVLILVLMEVGLGANLDGKRISKFSMS